jgi:hypothetical protein
MFLSYLWIRSRRNDPNRYIWRSQQRLELIDRINRGIKDQIAAGTLSPNKLLLAEGRVYGLWEAQRQETPPVPEVMNEHRDQYAKLLEFSYLKIRDLRTTGGQNLEQLNQAMETFVQAAERRSQ